MQAERFSLRGLACAVLVSVASAQEPFATSVVDFQQGAGPGVFNTAAILGGPRGGGFGSGSFDVLSLGAGGHVTLGFDVTLVDGPGCDFIAFENGFESAGGVFAEVAFVEVSTNGVDFAPLANRYGGPVGPLPTFGSLPYGTYAGFVGGAPVLANVDTNSIDPTDPVVSGGEAFDLADLAAHPLVLGGQVDLDEIHFVRIVDGREGIDTDSDGVLLWDSGGVSGSADIDAVAVIQHSANQDPGGPRVRLFEDDFGRLHLVLSDPDGVGDLDFRTFALSLNLRPVSLRQLRRWFSVEHASDGALHLTSGLFGRAMPGGTLEPTPFEGLLGASIRDRAGNFSADQLSIGGDL